MMTKGEAQMKSHCLPGGCLWGSWLAWGWDDNPSLPSRTQLAQLIALGGKNVVFEDLLVSHKYAT